MDITDNDGNTALHHCFQAQSQAIFGYNYPLLPSHFESALNLIKKGADIDMENHDCDTALDFVEENTSDIFECNSPLSLSFQKLNFETKNKTKQQQQKKKLYFTIASYFKRIRALKTSFLSA